MVYYIEMVKVVTVLLNVVSSKTFVHLQCKWRLSNLQQLIIWPFWSCKKYNTDILSLYKVDMVVCSLHIQHGKVLAFF